MLPARSIITGASSSARLLDAEAVTRVRAHLHPDPLRFTRPARPRRGRRDGARNWRAPMRRRGSCASFGTTWKSRRWPPHTGSSFAAPTRGAAGLAWHQDAQFFGTVAALNVWTALDDCGTRPPEPQLRATTRRPRPRFRSQLAQSGSRDRGRGMPNSSRTGRSPNQPFEPVTHSSSTR